MLVPRRFLPLPPRFAFGVNRDGSNGLKSIQVDSPSKTSSEMALPHAGAQAMPYNKEEIDDFN